MTIKDITLLSKEEFERYKSIIPRLNCWWWLKTDVSLTYNYIYVVDLNGKLNEMQYWNKNAGVRPLCTFTVELPDTAFWQKGESIIGSKITYGKCEWTVLSVQDGELTALCDIPIAKGCFDTKSNFWEVSKLKKWLEAEGLKLITT